MFFIPVPTMKYRGVYTMSCDVTYLVHLPVISICCYGICCFFSVWMQVVRGLHIGYCNHWNCWMHQLITQCHPGLYACVYVCPSVCISICLCVLCVFMCACVCVVYVCVCVCVCMCVCACVCV